MNTVDQPVSDLSWLGRCAEASAWCVLVGIPEEGSLTQIQRCQGRLLVVLPDQEVKEFVEKHVACSERLEIRVAYVGSAAAEVDWFVYNDGRFNGVQPLEQLQDSFPNLRLVHQERRQQCSLADFVTPDLLTAGRGLLLLVGDAEACVETLAGLGGLVEGIHALAVLPRRGTVDPAGVMQVLGAAACLEPVFSEGKGCLLELNYRRRVEMLEGRLAQINQELDEILALIDDSVSVSPE